LFYVCSEAMTNAAKHSGAQRIVVTIDGSGRGITVSISDDGRGGANASGSGLQGLADRLASRGGRLRVESPPGAGTTVTATVPY
jgi:signal transduction histidine kinase